MKEQLSGELGDQAAAQGESAVQGQSGGVQAGAINEAAIPQGSGQEPRDEGNTAGEQLPPELEEAKKNLLRDYHEKTQALADERRLIEAEAIGFKKDAEFFRSLASQDWFKQALQSEKAKRNGQGSSRLEIGDEEFQRIQNGDKQAFLDAVSRTARAILESQMGTLPSKQEVEALKAEREFERVADLYPDFKQINDKGLLDKYLERGLDYESAYARHKLESSKPDAKAEAERVRLEAEKLIQIRKNGAVNTAGVSSVRGGRVLKLAKNAGFDQAFDEVFKAVSAGEADVRVERERS